MAEQATFELRTDFSTLPQAIDFNFAEMKSYLTENLEKYKTLVVTEDAISAAKADRAKLRKLADTINQHKIAIKKDYMTPYTEFEYKIKELISLIDEATQNIDGQVKSFETLAKEEKRAALEKFFAENAEETAEVLTFEKIFNQKWLNATYSLDTAEADIISAIKKARTDLDLIRKTGGKYTAAMIEDYAQYRDMTSAMNKKLILEMREKLEEERKEKNEAAARAIEEEKRKREELQAQLKNTQDPQPATTPAEETMEVIDFRVWVTPEQKMKLRDFIVTNKIKYGRVPK